VIKNVGLQGFSYETSDRKIFPTGKVKELELPKLELNYHIDWKKSQERDLMCGECSLRFLIKELCKPHTNLAIRIQETIFEANDFGREFEIIVFRQTRIT
jgi:hypothetical protein